MKEIRQRLGLLFAVTALGLLAAVIILFMDLVIQRIHMGLGLIPVILAAAIPAVFLIREFGRYKSARLILENNIMHIETAQIKDGALCQNNTSSFADGHEVFISCFGILLGSRVIKFNIDGIKLKEVQIGHEFISLYYGTEKNVKKIRILHAGMDRQELQKLIDRFYFETGVVPEVLDS